MDDSQNDGGSVHAQHLQGAMQAMADGDIACSIEAVGARLSA